MNAETLLDIFAANADADVRVSFIRGADEETELSYRALYERSMVWLGWLQRQGLSAGDKLVLYVRDNQRFLELFWAALLGGIVPVPVAVGGVREHRGKALRILEQLHSARLLTETGPLEMLKTFLKETGRGGEIAALASRALTDAEPDPADQRGEVHPVTPEHLAFIQYSSGSTRHPKGVTITHANLLATLDDMCARIPLNPATDIGLSWMPLTHDMGLIGCHLCMVYQAVTHYLMDTLLFSRHPLLWLRKVHEKRATLLCSPNFGFKHYLNAYRKTPDTEIDLSCVYALLSGAEPISPPLIEDFLTTLAPRGLAREAMCPAYGLAEAGLAVSFPGAGAGMDVVTVARAELGVGDRLRRIEPGSGDGVPLALHGRPMDRCEVRIVDLEGNELAPGTVGEIVIRGPNVTGGYLDDPDANAELFTGDGWLRTGDLGTLLDGQVAVAGRLKDIIFINGQNHYPHDLEAVVEQAGLAELGSVVVSAVRDPDGTERIAVFLRHRGSLESFAARIEDVRRALFETTGVEVGPVLPIQQVPKTTSGKLRRYAQVAAYEAGEHAAQIATLNTLRTSQAPTQPAAQSDVAATVTTLLREVLGDDSVDPGVNFFDLGATSPELTQFAAHLNKAYPGFVDVTDFFDRPSVPSLAALIEERLAQAPDAARSALVTAESNT